MTGPYREAARAEVLEAPTRRGVARLEIAPDHMVLEVRDLVRIAVSGAWLTVLDGDLRRRPRARSLRLDHVRLHVARTHPTGEVSLWHEPEGAPAGRVLGLSPFPILDDAALEASRALDKLGDRLAAALSPHAGGATRAVEFGTGKHRVLVVVRHDRMLVWTRSVFANGSRLLAEVHADGTVIVMGLRERRLSCTTPYAILVRGNFVSFESTHSEARADIWLPWLDPEDRSELASLLASALVTEPALDAR